MNKKAIELSVNFLVITIISIVIFGFGIYLMNQFFNYGTEVIFEWDEQHQAALDEMMDRGEEVAIPFDHKQIGNKKFDKFAIGIFNILGYTETFTININFDKAYTKEGADLCDEDAGTQLRGCVVNPYTWLKSATGDLINPDHGPFKISKTIENYEKEKFLLGVDVKGAEQGTYLFTVDVEYPNPDPTHPLYDTTHILIVDVFY